MTDVQTEALHHIGSREQQRIRDISRDPTQAPIVAEQRVLAPVTAPKPKDKAARLKHENRERFGRDSTD